MHIACGLDLDVVVVVKVPIILVLIDKLSKSGVWLTICSGDDMKEVEDCLSLSHIDGAGVTKVC